MGPGSGVRVGVGEGAGVLTLSGELEPPPSPHAAKAPQASRTRERRSRYFMADARIAAYKRKQRREHRTGFSTEFGPPANCPFCEAMCPVHQEPLCNNAYHLGQGSKMDPYKGIATDTSPGGG